jgi:hypothetical protein
MNQKLWLRTGFVALLATAATGAAIVACDGDDTATPIPPVATDSGVGGDSSMMMTSDAGDGATASVVPKVILVHGANEIGAVRLCIATAPNGTPKVPDNLLAFSPLPFDTATSRLPVGFGAVLPLSALNVSKFNLVPVVIKATSLDRIGAGGRAKSCGQVLAGEDAGGLKENDDYYILPEIQKTDFQEQNTYAAVVVGCPLGIEGPAAAKCGTGYVPGAHNLRLQTYKLDRSSGGAGNVVQVVHGALPIDGLAGPVQPFIATQGADGGVENPIFPLGDAGVTSQAQAASKSAAPTPGAKTAAPLDYAKGLVGVRIIANGGVVAQSIAAAQVISGGLPLTPKPTFYAAGRGFTFIAVGDPTEQQPTDGGFNPLAPHFLVFDNDPVVPALPQ